MRRVLLITLLLSISIIGYADVYKYRVFQDKLYDNSKSEAQQDKWQDVDILVVLNTDKNKITIYANRQVELDVISWGEAYNNTNGDREIDFVAIDEDGAKCTGHFIRFSDTTGIHIATIFLEYSDFSFIYRLKSNN